MAFLGCLPGCSAAAGTPLAATFAAVSGIGAAELRDGATAPRARPTVGGQVPQHALCPRHAKCASFQHERINQDAPPVRALVDGDAVMVGAGVIAPPV